MKGRVVMVTGGGSGIGKATALLSARSGAFAVGVADIDFGNAKKVAKEIIQTGTEAIALQMDVADPDSMREGFDQLISKYQKLDILVNSAGICPMTPVSEITMEEWNRVLQINLFGSFFMCQTALKHMMENGTRGSIVNVGSIAGKAGGFVVGAHYAASKAGINCMTFSLAKYAARHGIRVNAVAPGTIDNELTRQWESKEQLAGANPMGRLGTSEEVAEAIVFLASSRAGYITGEVLDINGGSLMD